jgi:hypothetical protein
MEESDLLDDTCTSTQVQVSNLLIVLEIASGKNKNALH